LRGGDEKKTKTTTIEGVWVEGRGGWRGGKNGGWGSGGVERGVVSDAGFMVIDRRVGEAAQAFDDGGDKLLMGI
jgi:hypothetical protein